MQARKTGRSKTGPSRAAADKDGQLPLFAALMAKIEADILDGRLRAGERLEELALSKKYAVSRTPIREALRQLASAKLVDIRPRLGAVVARPTGGEVIDLFEVVAELEGVAAALAAERMTAGDRIAIHAAHDASRKSATGSDAETYYRINKVFHRAIHEAAHNLVLAEQIEILDKRLAPYRRFITFRPGRTQEALMEHDAVVEALSARDGSKARAAMVEHVRVLGEDAVHLVKGLTVR
jgi:DNA-binding GntR family transcriptional regulator